MELSHLDPQGNARMVDISQKAATERAATASASIKMKAETLALIQSGGLPKGDVFATARIAGIMAAKRTAELIPLCHPLPISSVQIEIETEEPDLVRIVAEVKTTYQTGVEMEALTAASVAALTIYDMCKAVDRAMQIGPIQLLAKSGGRSGTFTRGQADEDA